MSWKKLDQPEKDDRQDRSGAAPNEAVSGASEGDHRPKQEPEQSLNKEVPVAVIGSNRDTIDGRKKNRSRTASKGGNEHRALSNAVSAID